MKCLGKDSRWVLYGTMSGIRVSSANFNLLIKNRSSIIATTLRNRSDDYKADLVKRFTQEVIPSFSDGTLKPVIDKVMKLSEI